MTASLFPYRGFIWGVGTGLVLLIIAYAIWAWRHPE